MGLAASQARLLVLTARKSDLEFRAQNISNRKLLLSAQTENIATEYSRKLSNRQMRFVYNYDSNQMQDINELFTIDSVYAQNAAFIGTYRVVLADGRIAVPSADYIPSTSGLNIQIDEKGNVISGSAAAQDPLSLFCNMSTMNQLSYLAQAINNYCKSYDGLSETEKAKMNLNDQVTSDGHIVKTCAEVLDAMLNTIYGENAETLRAKDSSGEYKGFSATMASNMTADQKTAVKSIATSILGMSFASDATNEDYAQAVNKINQYYAENKDSGNDFLRKKVDATNIKALTDAEPTTMTKKAYLANMATAFLTQLSAGNLTTSSSEYTQMLAFLSLDKTSAAQLAYSHSDFGALVIQSAMVVASSTGTDGTQSVNIITSDGMDQYVIIPGLANSDFFQNALREGSILLEKFTANEKGVGGEWITENWAASSVIQDKLYTEDDAAAEAEYETQTAIIQRQDKMLDVEMKQIETQQKACENEIESVKKILDKNNEKSFKYMS